MAMENNGRPKEMSELRRKRMAEIAASGKRMPTPEEREALMLKLDQKPGLEELLDEADRTAAEYLKKASNQRELRRRAEQGGNTIPR